MSLLSERNHCIERVAKKLVIQVRIALWLMLPVALALVVSKFVKVCYEHWVLLPEKMQGVTAQFEWLQSLALPRILGGLLAVVILLRVLVPMFRDSRGSFAIACVTSVSLAFVVRELLGAIGGLLFVVLGSLLLMPVNRWWRWLLPIGIVAFVLSIGAWVWLEGGERFPYYRWLGQHFREEWGFVWWIISNDLFLVLCGVIVIAIGLTPIPRRYWSKCVVALSIAILLGLVLLAFDLAYFLRTHQLGTLHLLAYLVANIGAIGPAVAEEITPGIIVVLIGLPAFAILALPAKTVAMQKDPHFPVSLGAYAGCLVIICSLIVVPFHSVSGNIRFSPYTDNLFISLGRDLFNPELRRTLLEVHNEIADGKIPIWMSKNLHLVKGVNFRKFNIILVMLESIRASATSVHDPTIESMPYLRQLAKNSLTISEMYAVIPRTSDSWVSAIYGIYPGPNNVMRSWGELERMQPMFRGLPELLREHSYASAFFTSSRLDLDNERELISNMNFDHIVSEEDLISDTVRRVNYMGVEDNAMLPSFEAWVASQIRSNVPFFATIMTNVGHHKYDTPTNWKKKRFPAATNSDHENYLNCILYIDEFLQSVIGIIDHAGVRESTVFVFVGDHGDSVGTRVVQQGVRTLNEPNVHVLAVVHAPGLARMRGIVPGPRQLIDLLPTITEALGFEAKGAQLPGISLLSSVDENRSLYFSGSIDRSFLGLREGKMKYIYYFGRQPTMVFDLETDPDEMHSMLESLSVDEVRSKERKLLRWQELVSLSLRNIRN